MTIHKNAREFLDVLNRYADIGKGQHAIFAGGCVRDAYMGVETNDIDIATNIPMNVIEDNLNTHDIGANKDFGIIVCRFRNENFEVANFRKDGTYADGRHPDEVEFVHDFKSDAARRDFTINAMGMGRDGQFIDHFGGIADINNGIIRTVGDPQVRFAEDYLRMLRAIRFAARFDFKIEKKTWQAIVDNARKIRDISNERVWQELYKMAKTDGRKFASAIMMMADSGLLFWVLPDIDNMRGMKHCFQHHPEGDVFQHTMAAVASNKETKNPTLNIAILFHDVGKNKTTYKFRDGFKHSYYRHDTVGRDMMDRIAKRLTMPNDVRDAIKFTCDKHMMFHKLKDVRASKILSWIESPYWSIAYGVAQADCFSRGSVWGTRDWNVVKNRLNDIVTNRPSAKKTRQVVNGKRVMKLRGIGPSKVIGEIIKATVEAVGDGKIENNEQAIDTFIKEFKIE